MSNKEVSVLENFIKMAEATKPRLPTAYDRSIIGVLIGLAEAAQVELQDIKERLERLEQKNAVPMRNCKDCGETHDTRVVCPPMAQRLNAKALASQKDKV